MGFPWPQEVPLARPIAGRPDPVEEAGRRRLEEMGFRMVTPRPEQRAVVEIAQRWAESLLPGRLPSFVKCWYRNDSGADWPLCAGIALTEKRPIVVGVRADLLGEALFRTALHEFQHVHDAANHGLTTAERERRAEVFAAFAFELWKLRQRELIEETRRHAMTALPRFHGRALVE